MGVRRDVKRRRLRWLAPLDRRIADSSLPSGGGVGSSCCTETISGAWFRISSREARLDIRSLPGSALLVLTLDVCQRPASFADR
jgi:hypothetical protein